ncbi:hypothetical protein PMIN06_004233 [Paraphaeosphaeria minitans]
MQCLTALTIQPIMKLLTLATLCATVLTLPTLDRRDDPPPAPTPAPAPKNTNLYLCTEAGFKGDCDNVQVDLGKCYNADDKLNDKISSLGPDKGHFCTAYPDFDCSGKAFPFVNPGIWDLANYGFGDIISSWRCDELGGLDD